MLLETSLQMKAGGHVANYDFKDLGTINSLEDDKAQITEGFSFGSFNSVDNGYYLIERSAPSPGEKEITETIPYSQGILDFSMINDERYFTNRVITYKVEMFDRQYTDRKLLENSLKHQLMPVGVAVIKDTHDNGLHWLGKCKSIDVEDDEKYQTLVATIDFDCYPFAIGNLAEGSDIWDEVFFPNCVFQKTKYDIDGSSTIDVINVGDAAVSPEIIVTGDITVSGNFGSVDISQGSYSDTPIVLSQGENTMSVSGTGTIEFKFYKEVMI